MVVYTSKARHKLCRNPTRVQGAHDILRVKGTRSQAVHRTSSNRMTAYGRRRTASVSCPPWSKPTYPAQGKLSHE